MSKELFVEFESKTKQEWLAQAEKDLKGKPLSDLQFNIANLHPQTPFHHADDMSQWNAPIRREAVCKCQLAFKVEGDLKRLNLLVIKYLENGVNALTFQITRTLSADEWTILFKNIHFDYISVWVDISGLSTDNAELALVNLSSEIKDKCSIINSSTVKQVVVGDLDETANLFKEILGSETSRFLIQATPCADYYTNIAYLRALKHVVANIGEAKKDIVVSYVVQPQKNIENELLEATPTVLSAIIGGASSIQLGYVLSADSSEQDMESNRLLSNLYNLALLESNIEFVEDPSAGSYYLEKATMDMANSIWEKI